MVQLLFQELHVTLCFLGQFVPALAVGDVLVPAVQPGDHRFHTVKVRQCVEAGDFYTVHLITGDDRDLLHAAQHVQLGKGDLISTLAGQTVPAGNTVEGADPAGTAGGSAVFAASLPQLFVPLFGHGILGRKGACAHTGGIGFQYANHVVELTVGDAGTQRCIGRQRVRAGSEGEDAVIDIAHGTQLGFQHDELAAVVGLLQECTYVTDIRRKLFGLGLAPAEQGIVRHLFLMVAACQLHVLGVEDHMQAVLDALFVQMEQVAQTQGLFAVLVAVSIGDAAPGGAESAALLGKAVFFQTILHLVPGHGDGGLVGEFQVLRADGHAAGFDGLHFICEMVKVDDHAGAQHTGDIRMQDAGGQQVQDELALLGDDSVSGIVAALIAGNDIGVFGQQVDDTAFALIAPVDSSNSGKHNSYLPSFSLFTMACTLVGRP